MKAELSRHLGWHLPYRDVMLGYPPLSLLLTLAPRLVATSLGAYRVAYAILASGLYLLLWWLGLRQARAWAAGLGDEEVVRRAAICTLAFGPLLVARLDVLPAVLAIGALYLLATAAPFWAGMFILLGAAAKLYPLLLLPTWVALLWGFGGRDRRGIAPLLASSGLSAAFALLIYLRRGTPLSVLLESVYLYVQRPIQIESTLGILAVALGAPMHGSFGSDNVLFPGVAPLSAAWGVGMALWTAGLAVLAGCWAARHRHLPEGERLRAVCAWTAVSLLGILCTSKVLSPQYLVWLLPMVAILPGARGRTLYRLLVAALALTQVYFPFMYDLLSHHRFLPVVLVVLARDGLLWIMLVVALREAWRPRR